MDYNTRQLAQLIAAENGITATLADGIIRSLFTNIESVLAEGGKVRLPIGTFSTATQGARSGVNHITGKSWHSPDKTVPKFRYSSRVKRSVASQKQLVNF